MIKKHIISTIVSVVIAVLGIFGFYAISVQESVVAIDSSETGKQRQVIVSGNDDTEVFPITTETKPSDLSEEQVEMVENKKNEPALIVKTGKKIPDQPPFETASNYDNSIPHLIQLLNDPANDMFFRLEIAKALVQSGSEDGASHVFRAIIDAHSGEDYIFKENLIQILLGVSSSVETAGMLTDMLTGKASFSSDLSEIPGDIAYVIKTAIRLMPDETVGDMLAQRYYNETIEENKKILLEIGHPVMIARVALDAFSQGDNENADRLLAELAGVEDHLAIKGIMLLAREKSMSMDNVSNMLAIWSSINMDNDQTHFSYVEYLGNAEFSPEERAAVVFAIANEENKEMAIAALQKAQLFEEDPLVQQYISDALAQIDPASISLN